jgi:hypothetical protein
MGTDIEAAAIRRSDWGARRRCAGGCDRRCRARARGSGSGVVSVAAAGLLALLGGKAVERSP